MAFFTSFKKSKAGQAIFITNYKKMKVNNLADESVDDNVFRGDLTIGRNIRNQKFTFKYAIKKDEKGNEIKQDGKTVIRIVPNSATEEEYYGTFTTSVGWYPISKNGIKRSQNISDVLLACRKIGGSATDGADALSKLFEKGEAFFLDQPEGLPDDCILDPEQMVSPRIKKHICNVMTKPGKRMYLVGGPRSEFYIRCKMFKDGNISKRRQRKYITENDKQMLETYLAKIEELDKKDKPDPKDESEPEPVVEPEPEPKDKPKSEPKPEPEPNRGVGGPADTMFGAKIFGARF